MNEVVYEEARQRFSQGDLEGTLDLLRPLLGDRETDAKAWILEGRVRAACGEWQAAERAFERACTIAPSQAPVLSEYAHFLQFLSRPMEALPLIEQAIQQTPTQDTLRDLSLLKADVLFALIQAEILEEIVEEGQEREGAIPLVVPSSPSLQHWQDEGIKALARALQIDPRMHEAWDLKARYALVLGYPKDAVKAWQQALRNYPNHPPYLHELGITLEGMNDHRGATEAYKQLATIEEHRKDATLQSDQDVFAALLQSNWQILEQSLWIALGIPLPFSLWVEEIPAQTLLQRTDHTRPFDPWMPLFLDIETSHTQPSTIHVVFYQRNIEREADADSLDDLSHFLYGLIEDCFYRIDAMMNEDHIRNA